MRSFLPSEWRLKHLAVALLLLTLLSPTALASQSAAAPKPEAAKPDAALTSTERRVSTLVKKATISTVTSALASKEMQGRGVGQPGGEKSARYLADAMARLGL